MGLEQENEAIEEIEEEISGEEYLLAKADEQDFITYEDILNLTNGDFFKVFSADILKTYKGNEVTLPEDLEKVGYYRFE